jgi:hypothetical protein
MARSQEALLPEAGDTTAVMTLSPPPVESQVPGPGKELGQDRLKKRPPCGSLQSPRSSQRPPGGRGNGVLDRGVQIRGVRRRSGTAQTPQTLCPSALLPFCHFLTQTAHCPLKTANLPGLLHRTNLLKKRPIQFSNIGYKHRPFVRHKCIDICNTFKHFFFCQCQHIS